MFPHRKVLLALRSICVTDSIQLFPQMRENALSDTGIYNISIVINGSNILFYAHSCFIYNSLHRQKCFISKKMTGD